jgi:hypothetical protein
MQMLLYAQDNIPVLVDNEGLPNYLQSTKQIKSAGDLTIVTSNSKLSDTKNSKLLMFDEINYDHHFEHVICFHEKIRKILEKRKQNISNIPIVSMCNIPFESKIENIVVIAETDSDLGFILNMINNFYKNSPINFYIINSAKKVELNNVHIIEPDLKKILPIQNSFLVNLTNKVGFSSLINYYVSSGYPTASLELSQVEFLFNDKIIYFTANVKSLYIILDFKIKKCNKLTNVISMKPEVDERCFITLITQAYPIQDNNRKQEIEAAVKHNIANPFVNKIVCFLENNEISFSDEIMKSNKMVFINANKWITFEDIFKYANLNLLNNYVGIINIDIGLDHNSKWNEIKNNLDNSAVLALSRYEYKDNTISLDENFSKLFHCHTQDGWFFKAPLTVANCDFEIGTLGCDNAIAQRLFASGHTVINMMEEFKLLHFDNVRGKTGSNFLQFHKNRHSKYPETQGYRLLPNYTTTINLSIDEIIKQFQYSDLDKYNLICDIFSKVIKIKNT